MPIIEGKRQSCQEYAILASRARSDIGAGDIIVMKAREMLQAEEKRLFLQRERVNYLTFNYDKDGKVVIDLKDKEQFNKNLKEENDEIAKVHKIRSLFSKLDVIFNDVYDDLPHIIIPTLTGLIAFKNDQSNWLFKAKTHLKEELENRLTSVKNRNLTIDDVIESEDWISFKAEADKNLFNLQQNIKVVEEYINKVYVAMEMK